MNYQVYCFGPSWLVGVHNTSCFSDFAAHELQAVAILPSKVQLIRPEHPSNPELSPNTVPWFGSVTPAGSSMW
jgi:hypothetical protein